MGMRTKEFCERLNLVKASVKAGEATDEVSAKLQSVTAHLRRSWSPEQLKSALAADDPVPTDLEEALTTLVMLWMQQRGHTPT